MEQREGRILRQGNLNPEVQVFRYVTEESFDAYMWQTLETKARFIAQVMHGESDLRRIEDVDGAALTYAEVKAIASGNPIVIEKATVDAEVARLSRLRNQHAQTQLRMRTQIRHLTGEVPRLEQHLEGRPARSGRAARHPRRAVCHVAGRPGNSGAGHRRRTPQPPGQRMRGARGDRLVGEFAGFQVFVADNFMGGPEILLKGAATHTAKAATRRWAPSVRLNTPSKTSTKPLPA